ncbi:S8 family serine peptidase [Nocardia tengchongensis]|uniref:S8 family serine peptidase n=1 Tax=Nocardia tengchongensis TaxID=2055889 RepID=UPI003679AC43
MKRILAVLSAAAVAVGLAVTAAPAGAYFDCTTNPASCAPNQPAPGWALTRINQAGKVPAGGPYHYSTQSQGEGVNIYVIDGGVDTTLPEFGGRASTVWDLNGGSGVPCATNPEPTHGTEAAVVAAGATFGVAKKANILSVNAEDCGNTVPANYIKAINWVAADIKSPARLGKPAVVNISANNYGAGYLGFGYDWGYAVNTLVKAGATVTVSAGNSGNCQVPLIGWTACRLAASNPPANAALSIVVMASDQNDQVPDNSQTYKAHPCGLHWASSVGGDIYAPGVDVMTTPGRPYPDCGTSFAAPFVAGVAALYLATHPADPPATVKSWILANATKNAITNNPTDITTPNLLLNTGGL